MTKEGRASRWVGRNDAVGWGVQEGFHKWKSLEGIERLQLEVKKNTGVSIRSKKGYEEI